MSSEKPLCFTESADPSLSHSSRHSDDQDPLPRITEGHLKPSHKAVSQCQHSELKLKHLNERLSVPSLDISVRDDLVKQHAKIAEEAVSGWERAEAEAVALREQLDSALQQKLAAEDRVSHLDGALRDSLQQLRHVREEQEQIIHETIMKKTRDWDKVRCEFEVKLEDVERQLLEAQAENDAMFRSIKERAKSITEISKCQFQAEAGSETLQVRLDSVEKENATLRHEVHVLNKELEIHSEEKKTSKRAADVSRRQHLENVKKIAKLEAECYRLCALVEKTSPGPVAVAQMKLEVKALGNEKGESNRRRCTGKSASVPKVRNVQTMQDSSHYRKAQDPEAILECMRAVEEEAKVLKETLVKRDNELQAARLMCAKTATKLSSVEAQLNALSSSQGSLKTSGMAAVDIHIEASRSLTVSNQPSTASVSEDRNDDETSCAESWASVLIGELGQLKKERVICNLDKVLNASGLDLMDDFLEMERLASLSPSKIESEVLKPDISRGVNNWSAEKDGESEKDKFAGKEKEILEQMLATREAELRELHQLCKEVSEKLVSAEEQLISLQSKNAVNESILDSLHKKLGMIFEAQGSVDMEKVVEQVKSCTALLCSSPAKLRAHIKWLSKHSHLGDACSTGSLEVSEYANHPCASASICSSSEEDVSFSVSDPQIQHVSLSCPDSIYNSSETEASFSMPETESKVCTVCPELTFAITKVAYLVEDLAVAATASEAVVLPRRELQHDSDSINYDVSSDTNYTWIKPRVHCCNEELDNDIQKFIVVSNQFLCEKVDIVQFMAELSSVLGQLRRVVFLSITKLIDCGNSSLEVSKLEEFDSSEKESFKIVLSDKQDACLNVENSLHISKIKQEFQKVQAEKGALESQLRSEFNRFTGIEEELAQLKRDKAELGIKLGDEREKIEYMESQLHEAEQHMANLHVQLFSTESSKNLAEEQLSHVAALKSGLESQLKAAEVDICQLRDRVEALEKEVEREHKQNEDLEAEFRCLQLQLQQAQLACSCCAVDEDTKLSKESEIAAATEKLAECQQTILILGKQLQALASPKECMDSSYDSASDSALFIGKNLLERDQSHWKSQLANSTGEVAETRGTTRVGKHGNFSFSRTRSGREQRIKNHSLHYSGDLIVSDALDSDPGNPLKRGNSLRRAMTNVLPEEVTDMLSSVGSPMKAALRKKRSPQLFPGIDSSRPRSDAGSLGMSFESHGKSLSRLFSRAKGGQ